MNEEVRNRSGDYYRRFWKIEPTVGRDHFKGYIPSHEREGFDKDKIIQLPCTLDGDKK